MHVNHSYISSDFADLMEKELTLREQFRNYELDYSKNLKVKYFVMSTDSLFFKMEVNIYGNKRET